MQEKKGESKLKNSFVPVSFEPTKGNSIIKQDPTGVVREKLKYLAELHRRIILESGYDEQIAFRVIAICMTTEYQQDINLTKQISRFFNYCLKEPIFSNIQLCFDLLLMKEIKMYVKEEYIRLFKVKILRALLVHYREKGQKDDRKKCGYTLEEYCKASLQKQCVKIIPEIYQEILDVLIRQMKEKVSRLVGGKKQVTAIEVMTAFVAILEKSERIVSSRYQGELMEAYWALAKLHHQLCYLAYTRHYAKIALNIATRIQHPHAGPELRALLDQLA